MAISCYIFVLFSPILFTDLVLQSFAFKFVIELARNIRRIQAHFEVQSSHIMFNLNVYIKTYNSHLRHLHLHTQWVGSHDNCNLIN
ncbi:hypothetical protein PRUPE_8G222000 [Prunus persica]|uniref:Uncharacterized protein n=1 Tax=Prunus persica TaxID=3760 RepID=A0A251N1S9_PRUPE|nr:hypothetical protein PRUPE_8G222000 [Prunus persica]